VARDHVDHRLAVPGIVDEKHRPLAVGARLGEQERAQALEDGLLRRQRVGRGPRGADRRARTAAGAHIAGVTFSITIDSGEVYQLQSGNGDLTGTRVRGTNNKNFALFCVLCLYFFT
jgi:hypothetical protein